ncbi:hypothetical protein [Burkholderia sp. BE12]|nr:hypothetical protein [Burkholderia sp. BE12]
MSAAPTAHPPIDRVSLTGSTTAGRKVMHATRDGLVATVGPS